VGTAVDDSGDGLHTDGWGPPASQAEVGASADAQADVKDALDAGAEVAALPPCAWPASFNSMDASADECVAARTVLSFREIMGGRLVGLGSFITNDPTGCGYSQCWSECSLAEYGLQCGASAPPAGCRQGSSTLGGAAYPHFYCCPCGVPDDAGAGG
jgi:hypothetical protein